MVNEVYLWVVWRVAKKLREEGKLSLYNLAKALFIVEKEYEKRFGQRLIEDEFVWWHYGPYPWRLEEVLEELKKGGYIKYEVVVKVPEVRGYSQDDVDFIDTIVKHQLSEIEGRTRYIRVNIEPIKEPQRPSVAGQVEEVLEAVWGKIRRILIMRREEVDREIISEYAVKPQLGEVIG